MDTPSHFFADCLNLDDQTPYPVTPEYNPGDNDDAKAFHLYNSKLNVSNSPIQAVFLNDTKASSWDDFAGLGEKIEPKIEPDTLFVDPDLYNGDGEVREGLGITMPAEINTRPLRQQQNSRQITERTPKSSSSSGEAPRMDRDVSKKRRSRKARRAGNPEEVEKRSKFLERNRIAASKCREKKKQYVSDLEETKIGLETQHARLQLEYSSLLGEISGLKNRLMGHAKCNDPNIDRWLSNEARRFVRTSNELFGNSFSDFIPQTHQGAGIAAHSRNPSTASTFQSIVPDPFDPVPDARRGSIAYSHASSLQASPIDTTFPVLTSPRVKIEPDINYDHMPDDMFESAQATFIGE